MPRLLVLMILPVLFGTSISTMAQATGDYRLHAGDQLEVSVWQEEGLIRTLIVRPDGKFSFPLAGEVQAAGRTVAEVQVDLETRLKRYIAEPVVTLTVTDVLGNRVYVIGQVTKPGAYVMNPSLSVLQALSLAGGTTPFAKTDDIIILRGTGAAQRVLSFRYGQISSGRSLEQNVQLEGGDVVVVP
jgi:polysaccharide export outer membrane protein